MTDAAARSLEFTRSNRPNDREIERNLALSSAQRVEQHERYVALVHELERRGECFDWEQGLYSQRYLRELAAQHGIVWD